MREMLSQLDGNHCWSSRRLTVLAFRGVAGRWFRPALIGEVTAPFGSKNIFHPNGYVLHPVPVQLFVSGRLSHPAASCAAASCAVGVRPVKAGTSGTAMSR